MTARHRGAVTDPGGAASEGAGRPVSDGQLSLAAMTAEIAMLREHAARHSPARRRRVPATPREWRPPVHQRFWYAGYEVAMRDVLDLAGEVCLIGDGCAGTLDAVVQFAAGVIELGRPDENWPILAGDDQDGAK